MKALPDARHLLTLATIHAAAINRSKFTIAYKAGINPHIFERIRTGQDCTVKTYSKTMQWFSDHWPPGTDWPPDISRPLPRHLERAA